MDSLKHINRIPISSIEKKIGSHLYCMVRLEGKDEWIISGEEKMFIVEGTGDFKEVGAEEIFYTPALNKFKFVSRGIPGLGKSAMIPHIAVRDSEYLSSRKVLEFRKSMSSNFQLKVPEEVFDKAHVRIWSATRSPLEDSDILNLLDDFESNIWFSELLELTKLSQKVLALDIFELTPKTFAKYRSSAEKTPSRISELAVKLKELYLEGIDIFGDVNEFNKWLKEASLGLDDRIPLKILNTTTGIDLVYQELLKLEFGILA